MRAAATRLPAGLLLVLLATVTGCTPAVRIAVPAISQPCPTVRETTPPVQWPASVPPDLPWPPGAHLVSASRLSNGFWSLTYTSPQPVAQSLEFAVTALTKAGFTVGRGIAGASESRLPFTRQGNPGVIVLSAEDPCTTTWRVEV